MCDRDLVIVFKVTPSFDRSLTDLRLWLSTKAGVTFTTPSNAVDEPIKPYAGSLRWHVNFQPGAADIVRCEKSLEALRSPPSNDNVEDFLLDIINNAFYRAVTRLPERKRARVAHIQASELHKTRVEQAVQRPQPTNAKFRKTFGLRR
jgi:hypothetical protein